jgi:hypothetical protein
MTKHAHKPWRFILVLTLVTLLAFGTSLSLFGASVSPDYWGGNDPSVQAFVDAYEPDCENVKSAKYEGGNPSKLADGTFKVIEKIDGEDVVVFQVDIEFTGAKGGDEYLSINFSNASKPVIGVFLKAGPGGNMYYYNPGVYGDTNLIVPGENAISHVSFYYCDDEIDEPEYGSLKVTKEVFGDVEGLDELPDFIISVSGPEGFSDSKTLADGESYTWTQLKPGIYTVSEDTTGFSDEWVVEIDVQVGAVVPMGLKATSM